MNEIGSPREEVPRAAFRQVRMTINRPVCEALEATVRNDLQGRFDNPLATLHEAIVRQSATKAE